MGAAASAGLSDQPGPDAKGFCPVVVAVKSANDLRKADWNFGSGSKSDPYVIVRIGPKGSTWAQKAHGPEWKSAVVKDATNPEFNMLFSFNGTAPWAVVAGLDAEVHCRVYDEDFFTRDDFLGEALAPLPAVGADALEVALPLTGASEARGALNVAAWAGLGEPPSWAQAGSTAAIVVNGTRTDVNANSLESLAATAAGWFPEGDEEPTKAGSRSPPIGYFTDMVQLKLKPYSEVFYGRSTDGGETAAFPGPGAETFLTHAAVAEKLAAVPLRQKRGEIWRGGDYDSFLGFLRLPTTWWTDVEPATIALGCTVAQHQWLRPILDDMVGVGAGWTEEGLRADADAFLRTCREKGELRIQNDVKVFAQLAIHRQMFGKELSLEDGQEITDAQSKITLMNVLPAALLRVDFIAERLGLPSARKFRTKYLETYGGWIAESKYARAPWSLDLGQQKYLASAALDAVLFAGGLSIASVISCALAVAFGDASPLPLSRAKRTSAVAPQLVWETIRFFPAVVGFPWFKDDTLQQRTICNLAMALRDPRVWGDDAEEFKLRPVADYHRLSVAFADQAIDTEDGTMTRACPAKDYALSFCYAFVRAVFAAGDGWAVENPDKITFTGSTPFVSEFRFVKTGD